MWLSYFGNMALARELLMSQDTSLNMVCDTIFERFPTAVASFWREVALKNELVSQNAGQPDYPVVTINSYPLVDAGITTVLIENLRGIDTEPDNIGRILDTFMHTKQKTILHVLDLDGLNGFREEYGFKMIHPSHTVATPGNPFIAAAYKGDVYLQEVAPHTIKKSVTDFYLPSKRGHMALSLGANRIRYSVRGLLFPEIILYANDQDSYLLPFMKKLSAKVKNANIALKNWRTGYYQPIKTVFSEVEQVFVELDNPIIYNIRKQSILQRLGL